MATQRKANVATVQGEVDHTKPGLGRDGRVPKRIVTDIPVHSGMHATVRHNGEKLWLVGKTHTTALNEIPDASGQAPLDPTIPGKRLSPPAPAFGMRSRCNEVRPGDRGHVPDLAVEADKVLRGAVLSGSTKLGGGC